MVGQTQTFESFVYSLRQQVMMEDHWQADNKYIIYIYIYWEEINMRSIESRFFSEWWYKFHLEIMNIVQWWPFKKIIL